MTTPTLAQRVLALEHALSGIPHAFGGALALAYYAEPRATIDIERFPEIAGPLRQLGVAVDDPSVAAVVRRDGQVRVMWDATPIDLFFAYDAFHYAAGAARHSVPFGDETISILASEHLSVCKVIFDRPKDWVDIDAMLAAGSEIEAAEVLRWVARIAGDEDPRYNRIAAVLTRR
jgi:hypothetical protein